MYECREPNITADAVYQCVEEHTEHLHVRSTRFLTPKGFMPTEVWTIWEESRDNELSRICRTRGFITKNRKYIGYNNEWEAARKYLSYTFSEDAQLVAYLAESREIGHYRDLIQIVNTRFNKAVLSIVLDDYNLHGNVFLMGPFARMRFSRDNRKLLYFARPYLQQYDTKCDIDRNFILCIYNFDTEKVAVVTDETLCCKEITAVEWTPDGRGIVYYQDGKVLWHRFGENYHNKILSDCRRPLRMSFSPDGSNLAVFLPASDTSNHAVMLFKWPLVRAASLKHDAISIDPFHVWSVPERPWANDGQQLVFNVNYQTEVRVCVLNIDTLNITSMPFSRPGTVVDVRDDEMLLETLSGNQHARLWVSSISLEQTGSETASCLISQKAENDRSMEFYITEHFFENRAYSAVFVYPPQAVGIDLSLIVMPFWGPEPYYTLNHRNPVVSTFVNMGYCVLIVNYRKPFVEMITDGLFPTLTGPEHIADVHEAVVKIVEEYKDIISKDHIYLYGQKFGAFIASILVIREPKYYKRCVLVRPVMEFPKCFLEKNPEMAEVEPHLQGDLILTPTMMVLEDKFKGYIYEHFENQLRSSDTPFVKVTSEVWPDERFIRDVIDFFQAVLGDETE